MRRWCRWVIVCVLALATTPAHGKTPAAPAPVAIDEVGRVVLIDAGRAPRRPLRYKNVDDVQQTMTMSIQIAIEDPPGQPPSDMKFTMITRQSAAPNGRVRVTFHATDLDMTSGATPMPAAARERMNQLMASTKGAVVIDERGHVESVDADFDDSVPAQARAIMEQYLRAMKASIVALPDEPVGPGARWRQQMKMRSNSVKIVNDATYELRDVNDEVVVIERQDVQHAPRQPMPLPGGGSADLLSVTGKGRSSLTVDLRAYLPVRDEASLEVTMRMKVKGSPPATMRMSTMVSGSSVTTPAQ